MVLAVVALLSGQGAARGQGGVRTVRYLLLPHLESPAEERPSSLHVRQFLEAHPQVENTAEELEADLDFARAVLGQRQVLEDAAAFEAGRPGTRVRLRFLHPAGWRRRVEDEVRVGGGPFVCQLGDTWVPYFRARGWIDGEAPRYVNDVRFLWYWRDMVRPEELRTWAGLVAAAGRARQEGYPPLAIATGRDEDVLWNFAVWLHAAGGEPLYTERRWVGWHAGHPDWRGWTQAAIHDPRGLRAVRALRELAEKDHLALPDASNLRVTRDFMDRQYAMVVMEPWVAWAAERRWRDRPGWVGQQGLPGNWQRAIGATLVPPLEPGGAGTFIGGSMLALLPTGPGDAAARAAARDWIGFLLARSGEQRAMQALQYLPASEDAWRRFRYRAFFDEALAPLGGDASPAALARLRQRFAPPARAEWPVAAEQAAVTEELYWFWRRLDGLPRHGGVEETAGGNHEELAAQALRNAAAEMDRRLSPGQWWVRLLAFLAVAAPLAALLAIALQQAAAARRERAWRARLRLEKERAALLAERLRLLEGVMTLAAPASGGAGAGPGDGAGG